MPEIKQPEQLSLGLEDTRKGLFIDMEKLNRAFDILRGVGVPLGGQNLPRAPQPARGREQRMIRGMLQPAVIIIDDFVADARLEVHVGRMPENP